jgi:toxin ParE1/3/4
MRYLFHPEAEIELLDAIDYYEFCRRGLGYEFAIEVHFTIQNILSFPNAWPILEEGIRRCQIRRFPYGLIYSEHENIIYILAVMHLHRRPGYWQDRKTG